MPADELGLSLVDNPVAAGGATDEKQEELALELVPDDTQHLQRIAAQLSDADGKPSLAAKAAQAVLVVVPLVTGPYTVIHVVANAGDFQSIVYWQFVSAGALLCGPAALHGLQQATRPAGSLAVLGSGAGDVLRAQRDALRRWGRILRCLGYSFAAVALPTGLAFVVAFAIDEAKFMRLLFGLLCLVWAPLCLGSVFCWWYSLRVAVMSVATAVAVVAVAVQGETRRLREAGGAMDAERWASVESQVLRLGRDTLPALSAGYGPSVGLVAAGMGLFALAFILVCYEALLTEGWVVIIVLLLFVIAPFAALPALLAMAPAAVSSQCAKLEDDVNDLCGEALADARPERLLKYLKRLSKDQGLGFKVFGQVVTRRTLGIVLSSVYGVIAVLGPKMLHNSGVCPTIAEISSVCGSGALHSACPFGWTFADDSCFKLFGDKVGNPLSWVDAEEACATLGYADTHLASITSARQQLAVEHMASSVDDAWIGLNDRAEEGSFVWSDGEPLGYENWNLGEPNDGKDTVAYSRMGEDGWRETRDEPQFPYICTKKATPMAAGGGDMLGCAGGHWILVMGTPYTQNASTILPPTTTFGIYEQKVYDKIEPTKFQLNATVTTAAECVALVRRDHPDANAAEYSNVGREWCSAVFNADGVIHDPLAQTCIFE